MAVRTLVTRGFGNGTFSADRFVTRGYTIGNVVGGPFCIVAGQAHAPGSVAGQSHRPGAATAQAHAPGAVEGQSC